MTHNSIILSDIIRRLQEVRKKQNRISFLGQVTLFCTGLLVVTTVLVLSESLFGFSHIVRTILVCSYALVGTGFFIWMIVRPWLRWMGVLASKRDEELAAQVGDSFPSIKDRLVNAFQLSRDSASASALYSAELIDESLKEFSKEIAPLDFTQSIGVGRLPVYRRWSIISMVGIGVLLLSFPVSLSDAVFRLIHYAQEFAPPAQYYFEITPGNKEIVKGENVDVRVKVTSVLPSFTLKVNDLIIVRQQEGQETVDEETMKSDSGNIYRTTFQSVRASIAYYVRYNGETSAQYVLQVIDRPLIRSLHVRLEYPAYTKIPAKIMDEFVGDVTAVPGTRITITGSASKSLRTGSIQFGNNTQIELSMREKAFSATFPLLADNTYWIFLTDTERLSNIDPVHYQLKTIADEYPTVVITNPGRNIDIAGDQSIPLFFKIQDDYGFSSMRVGYRLIASKYEKPKSEYTYVPVPLPASLNEEAEFSFIWDLSSLSLVPEDVVEYFAEVFDNDAIRGPKSGRSNVYQIRLPSLDEVFADVDKEHERSVDELQQSLEEAKKLREDIESINRDLKKNKDPDWQTQKKMEQMANRYQEMQKKMDNLQSRVEQMTDQMQKQNVLSKETLEKYNELQQLFQEMDATELQRTLDRMRQMMPTMSKSQLQNVMNTMTMSEERFRQSIERTLNLLKRLQIEQKMDEVNKRVQELEKAERDLKDESAKTSDNAGKQQELAKKQQDLIKKEQALEREAADLQHRMEEFFTEMPADKLQKSLDQLKQQKLDQKMQQAGQQLQMGNMQSAQNMQQQISDQLQQFGQQMSAMQQQMLQQQSQYVMNAMRKAINNILEISKDEEALKQQSQEVSQNSPQLGQNAQKQQQALQDLDNVMKDLQELSQRSFAVTPEMGRTVGEAVGRMNNALRALEIRSGSAASQEQSQAMGALNRAATQVQSALQSMMQSGGSGGSGMGSLMQQLQMMAGQQMSLNMQTQQLGGMSQQQAAEASRLGKEQGGLQKSLEQLNREAQQSGDQQKLLGDLQKIADEMKEVASNLEQNNVNPETIKKQERILSRLLDASKSTRERDYEKKRKAETGTAMLRRSPNELDWNALQGKSRLQEELLKALEHGYSKDYQDLIRKYFEELEKTEKTVY